jgi:REP element-mobilizing transposase RayT
MIRGIERRNIFRNKKDREDFLERLGRLLPETHTACYGWSFLSNHAHFLFRTGDIPLSNLMRRLLTGYVISFNRRHKRHGQLFQNRFKSIVCQEEVYLNELVRYIHLNPIRAGLVTDIDQLDRYPYSGHSALMGFVSRAWQGTDYVLSSFDKTLHVARLAYRSYMEEGLQQGRRTELVGGGLVRSLGGWKEVENLTSGGRDHNMSDERILGEPDFVEAALSQAEEAFERRYKLKSLGYDLPRLAERAAEIFGIDVEEIYSPGRKDRKVKARSLVCFWASRELGISLTELARTFGMSVPGIGYAVERGEKLVKQNKFTLSG